MKLSRTLLALALLGAAGMAVGLFAPDAPQPLVFLGVGILFYTYYLICAFFHIFFSCIIDIRSIINSVIIYITFVSLEISSLSHIHT